MGRRKLFILFPGKSGLKIWRQDGSDHVLGTVTAEWLPAFNVLPGLSVFADAGIGDEGYDHVYGRLRYYFGTTKTLMKRHREDDPENGFGNGIGLNNRPPPEKEEKNKKKGICELEGLAAESEACHCLLEINDCPA